MRTRSCDYSHFYYLPLLFVLLKYLLANIKLSGASIGIYYLKGNMFCQSTVNAKVRQCWPFTIEISLRIIPKLQIGRCNNSRLLNPSNGNLGDHQNSSVYNPKGCVGGPENT